ncbi:MAG: pitrilysin family protein [Thermomicrobiales bacterium]
MTESRAKLRSTATSTTSPQPLVIHTLANGLKIFLRPNHAAPLASFWTWYRVGSRNEIPGRTGLSHWVEHMQFKGTPTQAKGSIFGRVSREGGTLNAMTSMDWTAYFETLPADRLDLSLAIESDRMTNSLFDPEETESERTVILSERQGAENRQTYTLAEEVMGAAFQAHPYGHMVIGYEDDLRRISRDDLYHHYRRFYTPDNAFITAAGDFDPDEMIARIEEAFGAIPAAHQPLPPVATEPPQRGERCVTVRKASPAAYMMMAYKIPGARHPDIPALMVADAVLSGAKAMGMGGGSGMGRSSRLYRALVATGLARSAGSGTSLHVDPHLWTFSATALPGVEPERIEAAFEAEIHRLQTGLATEEEFAKARKQIRAQYVYSNETVTSQAFWLGQMEIVDHAERVDTLADELDAVTPEDVQRVARTWLTPSNRTVGWQLPEESRVLAGAEMPADLTDVVEFVAQEPHRPWGFAGDEVSSHGFVRTTLPNGIVVLAQPRPGSPAIGATISVEAGQAATGDERAGLASLTARMLTRGTERRTFDELNEATDGLGAMLVADSSREAIEVSFQSLAEDFDRLLDLSAEVLRAPVFPDDELERVRQQTLTGLREQDDDTGAMASRALRELLYPVGHPYRLRLAGEIETVSSFTRDDLAAYHAGHFGPGVTTIAVVGGVDGLERATSAIERVFDDWRVDVPAPAEPPTSEPVARTERKSMVIPGKSQANIAIGYPTIARHHPDYYALTTANVILGQLGLMGRLGASVRDKQGLAYHVSSSVGGGLVNSLWSARAGVNPNDIDRALAGIVTELQRLRSEAVTVEELADAKSYLTGSLPLGLESMGGVIDLLLSIERNHLGLDYLDRYPEIINGLTREHLLQAAHDHLDPGRLAIGIAGPDGIDTDEQGSATDD